MFLVRLASVLILFLVNILKQSYTVFKSVFENCFAPWGILLVIKVYISFILKYLYIFSSYVDFKYVIIKGKHKIC